MNQTDDKVVPRTGSSPFRTVREREVERAEKRQAVLVAAVRMFNERGFHATSLDDVAASLGVTKPVIYHYLGNRSEEHTSELQSLMRISYAVFCLKKKKTTVKHHNINTYKVQHTT